MDRKWMSSNRMSKEFEDGVKEFVKVAVAHAEDTSKIICPCLKCCYGPVSEKDLARHLIFNGIDKSYTCWTMHGEEKTKSSNLRSNVTDTSNDFEKDTQEFDRVEEFVNVIKEDLRDCPGMFERLVSDSEKPLYDGCTKFTRLSTVLKLYNLKMGNGWSDKSFTDLLTLLKDMLPENNVLPSRTYEAKRMLCSIGMSYEKIHAYPNDCILFRNEYASLNMCPKCSASQYKKGTSPAKALWYFPIIPRFRRMYHNAEDAKHLTWHADERVVDGMLRHPADSPQWAKIDDDYPDFGQEPRNLRLALSSDGVNPHGIQSCSHNTWPVMLLIYNLPPSLCMKRKYLNVACRKVHWALLVIDPDAGIIYYLDPMATDPTRHLICKKRFENALLIYRAYNLTKPVAKSKLNRITWIRIECPQQTNTTDCGYFVMRFMKEIVMQYPKKIPDKYFDEYKCRTYSKDKLDEVKDEWAEYMFTNVIPGGSWIKEFLKP